MPRTTTTTTKTTATKKATKRPRSKKITNIRPSIIEEQKRWMMIAEAAYLRAQNRGFSHGNQEEDWFHAEKEVDSILTSDRA